MPAPSLEMLNPRDRAAAEANMAKLPRLCGARNPATGEPIVIRRGEVGFYPQDPDFDPDLWNGLHGVTPAQREAMAYGSCFGWHAPIADPDKHPQAPAKAPWRKEPA